MNDITTVALTRRVGMFVVPLFFERTKGVAVQVVMWSMDLLTSKQRVLLCYEALCNAWCPCDLDEEIGLKITL